MPNELPPDAFDNNDGEGGEGVGTFITITPQRFSAECCVRAAKAAEEALSDPQAWLFALIDLHTALGSALVAALRGTNGVGAFVDRDQGKWLDWFEDRREKPLPPPAPGRLAEFGELLHRVQSSSYAPMMMADYPIVLSDDELKDLHKLNQFRGNLAHVKPTHWSLEVSGLPRMCGIAARLLGKLFELMPVYAGVASDLRDATVRALARIGEIADLHRSLPPEIWEARGGGGKRGVN